MGRNLYQETFSHVRSSYEFNMEDFEKMKTAKKTVKTAPIKKIALIAAAVAVLAALGITASATGFFGFSDMVMPEADETYGEYITMRGYVDSPESQALAEYLKGGTTIEKAAEKYGLTGYDRAEDFDYQTLTGLLGGEPFDGRHMRSGCYMFEDGTFGLDGTFTGSDGLIIDYSLYRAVKGSLTDALLTIGGMGDYTEWELEVGGTTLALALGEEKSVIMADLGSCFVTVNVLTGYKQAVLDTSSLITDAGLESLAKSFNWSALAHVEPPEMEPEIPSGAGVELLEENIDRSQSFKVRLAGWDQVNFITYLPTEEFDDVRFFLSKDGKMSDYELERRDMDGTFDKVAAVSFEDLTGDDRADILVIVDYKNAGIGEGMDYRDVRIFRAVGDGSFAEDEDMEHRVKGNVNDLTVGSVRKFLKTNKVDPQGPDENGDSVLKTVEFTLKGRGTETDRQMLLEAVGKKRPDTDMWGVREIRVYDLTSSGGNRTAPTQTIRVADIGDDFVPGALGDSYTDCWDPEDTVTVQDMNLDGQPDIGVFGWITNNTIPYYYWFWDGEAGRFRYALTLQGPMVDEANGRIIEEFKSGAAGSKYTRRYYKPDENGGLQLVDTEEVDYGSYYSDHPATSGSTGPYEALLRDYDGKTALDAPYRYYTLFDLDGDGTAELLIQTGTCEADAEALVYGVDGDEAKELGRFGMGHSLLYDDGKGGVVRLMGQMGCEEIDRVTLRDGKVTEEHISSRELDPEESYAEPGKMVPYADYFDLSIIRNMDYSDILDQFAARFPESGTYLTYCLADIDRDGAEELFVKVERGEWSDSFYVYALRQGRALPLGRINGRKTSLATDGEKLYAEYIDPTSGVESIEELSLDGEISLRTVSSRTELAPEEMDGLDTLGARIITPLPVADRSGLE